MLTDKAIVEQKGQEYLEAVVVSQQSKRLRDTGYSAENTRFEVTIQSETLVLSLIGPAYWRQQQYGRGPNKSRKPSRAMVEKMKGWAVRHGMDESAGYPIALKIAREGIEVPNPHNPGGVLSDPLGPERILPDLKQSLSPLLRQSVKALLFA